MKTKYIAMSDLKENYLYQIEARHAMIGVWVPDVRGFLIATYKFGMTYPDFEYHWDTGAPYGTAKPVKEIIEFPMNVQEKYDENKFVKLIDYFQETFTPL